MFLVEHFEHFCFFLTFWETANDVWKLTEKSPKVFISGKKKDYVLALNCLSFTEIISHIEKCIYVQVQYLEINSFAMIS